MAAKVTIKNRKTGKIVSDSFTTPKGITYSERKGQSAGRKTERTYDTIKAAVKKKMGKK